MPTKKPARVPAPPASIQRFSLVPSSAQKQMYKALVKLKPADPAADGTQVAEIAVRVALGEKDPVILACDSHGARAVPGRALVVSGKHPSGRMAAATVAAVSALLRDATATALVCAGKLEAREDFRSAFGFAARHKLPILFLVANSLASKGQRLDLSKLYVEFGIPVFSVDTNDAIAVYRVATEALHNARHHRGPCVIEALTVVQKDGSQSNPVHLLQSYMALHENWPL